MLEMLTPFQEKGQAELNVKIGYATADLVGERKVVRSNETNLGNLIATAMMDKVGADIGIMNSGGIRDNMEAGDITYKSVLKVQPFGNAISYVDLTAEELKDYLSVVAAKQQGSGAFAQFAGVALTLKDGRATEIQVNGAPLDEGKTYRIAINSYVATGGDGYPKVTDHPNYVNSGYVDADVLVEYFQSNSPVDVAAFAPSGAVKR
jgi:5''-nucleotidase/2'',3''-cyclic phosphodiesterase and related esterases